MNLRFVEAFYWAASLKSVTRAAEKLFITQSALSSRIASLEEELGVLLLDRRDKQGRTALDIALGVGTAGRRNGAGRAPTGPIVNEKTAALLRQLTAARETK